MVSGVAVAIVFAVGGILLGLYLALQRSPDFYQSAVAVPVSRQEAAGRQFERNVLGLHNDLQQSGAWTRLFTTEEINGWLAVDLPKKFPQLLPPEIHEPRVGLSPGQLRIAFRYEGPRFTTVVSLLLEVQLADEPNTLAVRIRQARAGAVPIPLKDFLDQLSESARRANLKLRWAHRDGDPVALITIPGQDEEGRRDSFTLTTIEIRDNELILSGHTGASPDDAAAASTTQKQGSTGADQSGTK